jgi:hypothetical protein
MLEEHLEESEHSFAAQGPEAASGQLFMIRMGVEALLEKGDPLPVLKPSQAWRRITKHLESVRAFYLAVASLTIRRSIRRIIARMTKARWLRVRFS